MKLTKSNDNYQCAPIPTVNFFTISKIKICNGIKWITFIIVYSSKKKFKDLKI